MVSELAEEVVANSATSKQYSEIMLLKCSFPSGMHNTGGSRRCNKRCRRHFVALGSCRPRAQPSGRKSLRTQK